ELHMSQKDLTNPWHAAFASAASFTVGATLPLLAVLLPPHPWRIPLTFVSVIIALAITGWISARLGGSRATKAIVRIVGGGVLALAVTYAIGALFGVAVQ
ncbi:MAG: VIT1/CCC1 transporter family protein, partial [Terrimesophilobacter sp.]